MGDITVEIDGLPVEVDEDEWTENPEMVTAQVRENRASVRLGSDPELADTILGHKTDSGQTHR
jgi:hypothetical protein